MGYELIGAIVLCDEQGVPYSPGPVAVAPVVNPNDALGMYVLIDPETNEPYAIKVG